jgi:hypothetical protein
MTFCFKVFDIHINGAFHASVRYRLLFELHEKIVETFGLRLHVPEFPPKKMWRLDARALQTRRELLGKYLQSSKRYFLDQERFGALLHFRHFKNDIYSSENLLLGFSQAFKTQFGSQNGSNEFQFLLLKNNVKFILHKPYPVSIIPLADFKF